MSKRERYLFVCVNRREDGAPKGSCAARGSEQLYDALKAGLKGRGLAEVRARACSSSCLDVCWDAPVIWVMPDNYAYGRVQAEDLPEILDSLASGQRVERLVLSERDFYEPREQRRLAQGEQGSTPQPDAGTGLNAGSGAGSGKEPSAEPTGSGNPG